MGIKHLWSILEPFSERKPLFELQGKIVAIDLSGWVCESLCVVDYMVQPRFYLRNLFFRTCYLLLSGVTPVFVLEGDAPPLKYGVICKRNEIQFRGAKPRNNLKPITKQKPQQGRSRFNYVLKQCEDLITSMGIQCVQGPGEAEAFCAYLNQDQMVDGVISQDSDCFAYGATVVFRNFSVSAQGANAAQGGAVDIYDMNRVWKSIDLGKNKIIAMALICGCDYCPDGVEGIGKEAVLKLFQIYGEKEILDRIKSWRSLDKKFNSLELKVDDKSICVNCGHHGRIQNHTKNGCGECRQHRGCDASLWKDQRLAIKTELQIRKKAMTIEDFPSPTIIDEFFDRPINLPKLDLHWKQPNMIKFLKFMSKLMQWDEIYCFQKFLPLLTRWLLFHYGDGDKNVPQNGSVCPDFIKKKRAPKGVASYEIIWKDEQKCFDGLIPDEQFKAFLDENPNGLQTLWSTIEPADLFERAYPDIVNDFLETKTKKCKSKKTTKKKEDAPDKISRKPKTSKQHSENSSEDNAPVKIKKKKVPTNKNKDPLQSIENGSNNGQTKGNQLIDKYFKKTKISKLIEEPISPIATPKMCRPYESPKIKTSSTPMNLSNFSFDWNESDIDDHDLSEIIHGIVKKSPEIQELCGRRLRFDSVKLDNPKLNESYDEFDLMVLKKYQGEPKTTYKSDVPNQMTATNSSTPIAVQRFLKRNSLGFANKNKHTSSESNVSHFFGDVTADVDLFEKSIDYKNMVDEFDGSEPKDDLQKPDDFEGLELSDTFDLGDYVPIGAKLKKWLIK